MLNGYRLVGGKSLLRWLEMASRVFQRILEICWSCFSHPPGAGVTARFSLCEDGGAEDSEERELEEEEGH